MAAAPAPPVNPGQQGIAIHDIFWCPAEGIALNVTKTVAVIATDGGGAGACAAAPDSGAADQFATPGACVQYLISVAHPGGPPATNIQLTDVLPNNLTFAGASSSGFVGGAISTTNTGKPPMTIVCTSATVDCVVRLVGATLESGDTGVLTIRALVE